MGFKQASKSQSKARIALFGPSGSGKTYSALAIATGLAAGGRIGLIDSEFGRASNYSDRFSFATDQLKTAEVDEYLEKIEGAKAEGFPVLIIDSLTHGWHTLLQQVDEKTNNKFQGWGWGSPKQKELIRAIVGYPGHVVATIRAKTEWAVEANDRGKMVPRRVGLAPEQGKGIEYEFDILLEINADHIATVIKDNLTGTLQDKTFNKPSADLGAGIQKWLTENTPINVASAPEPTESVKVEGVKYDNLATPTATNVQEQVENFSRLLDLIAKHKIPLEKQMGWCKAQNVDSIEKLSDEYVAKVINAIESKYASKAA